LATAASFFWKEGEGPEAVAQSIREGVPGLSVASPAQAQAQLDRALAFLRGVINGGGLVALLVASLAVANTTFTAMVERRREIGLWRVVGAAPAQGTGRPVLGAGLLGFFGRPLRAGSGRHFTPAPHLITAQVGAPVSLIPPRFVVAAALPPPTLSALAALPPVLRATRRAPVEALRYA